MTCRWGWRLVPVINVKGTGGKQMTIEELLQIQKVREERLTAAFVELSDIIDEFLVDEAVKERASIALLAITVLAVPGLIGGGTSAKDS